MLAQMRTCDFALLALAFTALTGAAACGGSKNDADSPKPPPPMRSEQCMDRGRMVELSLYPGGHCAVNPVQGAPGGEIEECREVAQRLGCR